jgi:DNA-binding PadR family transcriptional regulator
MPDMNQWEAAFRKGFAKPIILQILFDEGESYPYQLTKQIPKRTMGMLTMATSNIYPVLKNLKDDGLICEVGVKERKIMYGLTEEGKIFLSELKVSIGGFLAMMLKNFE